MNAKEILTKLETIQGPARIELGAGPLRLKINEHDALAARLLNWLGEQLPEDATQGDLEDVLDSARWWAVFLGSLVTDGPGEGGTE